MTVVDASDVDGLVGALRQTLNGGPALVPLPPDPAQAAMVAAALDLDRPVPPGTVIIASSGSTGAPKGVVLSAAAIVASVQASERRLGSRGTWHLALPAQHVAGLMVLARSIVGGRAPVTVSSDLSDLSPQPGPNFLSIVPTQAARALSDPVVLRQLASFDAVLLGGAAASSDLLQRLRAEGVAVVTTYGMSETCGGCVYDGSPLDITRVRIGDDDRIELAGPMIFDGYRGRLDLTSAAISDGWFRTGDRGRIIDDQLEVLGRVDDVVISGGTNVDLAELQQQLAAAGLLDAVALAVPDADWGQRVVVAVTGDLSLGRVRELLADRVAPAALPRGLARVSALPLLGSGKPDRQRLLSRWSEIEQERR